MGKALQVVTGHVTNPSTTFTALTAASGDSFTVPNFTPGSAGRFLTEWTQAATGGEIQVRSPKLHDNVHGIRLLSLAALPEPIMGREQVQRLYPQDNLTVEMTGGAAEVDMATLLLQFDDLPGADARLVDWSSISPRIVNLVGILTTHAVGATAGEYSGSVAINADDDRLQANTDYAILGYLTDTTVCTVGYTGPDFANLRVGGPGQSNPKVTRDWFREIASEHMLPLIPVFNSANKGVTTVDIATTATSGTVNVTTLMAQLAPIGA